MKRALIKTQGILFRLLYESPTTVDDIILRYLKDPKLWELWYIPGLWVMQDLYHQPSEPKDPPQKKKLKTQGLGFRVYLGPRNYLLIYPTYLLLRTTRTLFKLKGTFYGGSW